MNIENASWQDKLDVLRLMWKNGELSTEKLSDMLGRAINMELSKADELVDNAFIDACEGLLEELAGDLAHSYKSHKKQNWRAIRRRLKKSDTVPLKRLLPAFGLAAVLIVGLVAMEVFLPKGRVDTFVTPDEQMYVVQGAESDRALIPSAMASLGEDEVLSTSTADPDELNAFLGFTPLMPTHIPSGWELDQYEGHITQTDWMFLMILHNEKEEHTLTYQVTASTTYDGFGLAFHQNETGSRIQLPNGLEGYLAYNYDDILITWLDGLTCYDISGPISSEEALNMIESIK